MHTSTRGEVAPSIDLALLQRWDQEDPLRRFRDEFALPAGVVYLDGNSLGALPKRTRARLEEVVVREWGQGLIRSWNDREWIDAPLRVGNKIARLIGAREGEVVVADSTSVNLFKLIGMAIEARPQRSTVLSEPGNFPTDLYMIEGAMRCAARPLRLRLQPAERIADSIDADTALVLLTHVHYKTAAMHDMRAITRRAHELGALVLWDLSHSAGALDVDLDGCDADMAVGCGYKYLNGGPGAPAFLFLAQRHHALFTSPLSGWMGHARPFAFEDGYEPAPGIRRYQCGTPPILGLLGLEASVDLLLQASMKDLVAKSRRLGRLFVELVAQLCPDAGLQLVSPADAGARGSHVAFAHRDGYAIMQALIERGVIGDFRAPDMLRFGFAPLYLRYEDIWHAVRALADVLGSGCWRHPRYARKALVT